METMPAPTELAPTDALDQASILTGPTGAGKTALALELAKRIDAEIIAMDSMTVYRGMDIGTAKPTAAERAEVPHHLLDVLDPGSRPASPGGWARRVKRLPRLPRGVNGCW
jgi:tRNA dimethylallyltransferase